MHAGATRATVVHLVHRYQLPPPPPSPRLLATAVAGNAVPNAHRCLKLTSWPCRSFSWPAWRGCSCAACTLEEGCSRFMGPCCAPCWCEIELFFLNVYCVNAAVTCYLYRLDASRTASERHGDTEIFIPQLCNAVRPLCTFSVACLSLALLAFPPRDTSFFGTLTRSDMCDRSPQAQPSTSECLPAATLAACRIPEETATFLSRLRYDVFPCILFRSCLWIASWIDREQMVCWQLRHRIRNGAVES